MGLFIRTGQRVMAKRRRGIIRSYSLSYEAAEKIKSLLDKRDARLVTPEYTDPLSKYKGLVILSAPYCGYRRAVKIFSVPYLESGLPVVIIPNANAASIVFNTPAQHRIRRVFNVLSANMTETCPVVIKLYCTSISTYIPAVADELSKPGCKLKLTGAIFDSGPAFLSPMSVIEASTFISSQNRYPTWFHRIMELLPLLFLVVICGQKKIVAFERVAYSPFLNDIPQLYMYSTTDDVINTDYINKLIDYQRQHNADVTRYVFSDTLHMLHRLEYPNEYDKMVIDFLKEKCDMLT